MAWLAWSRWRLRMPEDWRPLKHWQLEDQGYIALSDAETAVARVSWWDLAIAGGKPEAVFEKRRRRAGIEAWTGKSISAPGFDEAYWLPEVESKSGEFRNGLFLGWSASAKLVVEFVVNQGAGAQVVSTVRRRVVPSIEAVSLDRPTPWSFFGVSFVSPAGWLLNDWNWTMGDALVEVKQGRDRMALRQVYPAALALKRRNLEDWMQYWRLRRPRKFRLQQGPMPWAVENHGETLYGYRRRGRKRYAFPFGWLSPRHSMTAVMHDPRIAKILLVQHDTAAESEFDLIEEALEDMNWAIWEEG